MNTQAADQLYDEFRQASLAWLDSVRAADFDKPLPEVDRSLEAANRRMERAGEAIKQLPADAPGALRAKAALALFWYDSQCQDEIEADINSEGWDVATRADLTRAAAVVMCPDYFEALTAARAELVHETRSAAASHGASLLS